MAVEAIEAADPAMEHPRFVSDARRTPPEDVGSVSGYEEFVRTITRAPCKHKVMLAWHGDPRDPDDMDLVDIIAALSKPPRRRTPDRAAYLKSAGRQH